jgi:SH3-like domain-containing protein
MNNPFSLNLKRRIVNRMARCLIIIGALFAFYCLIPPEPEAAEETIYVKVLVARVRKAPSTESPILFKVRRGDPVVVDQKQGEWYHIRHPDGRMGWAHQKLFTVQTQDNAQTPGQNHNLTSVQLNVLSSVKETISFQLDSFHPPETFVLKGERPRVVCDFLNTRVLDSVGDRVESNGSLVKDIRIAPYGGSVPRVRVVLDLSPGRRYMVDQTFYKQENRYIVTVAAAVP